MACPILQEVGAQAAEIRPVSSSRSPECRHQRSLSCHLPFKREPAWCLPAYMATYRKRAWPRKRSRHDQLAACQTLETLESSSASWCVSCQTHSTHTGAHIHPYRINRSMIYRKSKPNSGSCFGAWVRVPARPVFAAVRKASGRTDNRNANRARRPTAAPSQPLQAGAAKRPHLRMDRRDEHCQNHESHDVVPGRGPFNLTLAINQNLKSLRATGNPRSSTGAGPD